MLNRPISARRIRTQAEWKVDTHISRARLPTSSVTRFRISAAALLVKVIARIDPGWTLRSPTRYAIRRVSTRVLPEPAPATTSTGAPAWSTAARCGGFKPANSSSADLSLRRDVRFPACGRVASQICASDIDAAPPRGSDPESKSKVGAVVIAATLDGISDVRPLPRRGAGAWTDPQTERASPDPIIVEACGGGGSR